MQKFLFILVFQLFTLLVFSHNAFSQDCHPPEVIFNKNAKNMFTEEQEIYLGEAMAERTRRNYRVIDDAELSAYLNRIGNRLVKHLPPTTIKFKFNVVDLPEANAFISAGGNVYVTRKLIGFVKSEDELAGVMAHELGHGIVRHSAITMTKYFEELLNVKTLGDRKDVFDKYNQYLEKIRTKRVKFKRNHTSKGQLEADEIGVYSLVAAGYNGNGLTDFWDRFTELDGKAGNWFTDLLGNTRPSQKRYREMLNTMKKIPAGCLDKPISNSEAFRQWQAFVVNYSGLGGKESLTALVRRQELTPPLQAEINHLQFSPDGKYIIAQDDSGINVLSQKPFSFLFRIEAPEVKNANFTEDSKHIIFYNTGLRVQKWSVAEKRAISITETYIRKRCWQSELSPDGTKIACFDYSEDLAIYEVETNKQIYKKKRFYVSSYIEYFSWTLIKAISGESELPLLNMQFSPDSKYLLAGRKFDIKSARFITADRAKSIGIDIEAKKEIKLNKNLKKLIYAAFTFYSNDKLIGQFGTDEKKSGVFSFPEGERVEEFYLRGQDFSKSAQGDYLMVRPVSNAPVGVYDLKAKKFIIANKKSAFDIYGEHFIAERKTGEIGLYKIDQGSLIDKVELPNNDFGTLRATALSPDGKWLAISERSRGALWNLESGERVFHIRGFRGGYFSEDGLMYSDFPKNKQMERMVAVMNPAKGSIAQGNKIETNNTRQFGSYLVSFKSNSVKASSKKAKKDEKKKDKDEEIEEKVERIGFRDVTMSVRSAPTGIELWSREFEDERPRYSLNTVHNTLTLAWRLSTKTAKSIIKKNRKLENKLSKMEDKDSDYLLQILQPQTGKVIGQVLLETGEGSFDIDNLTVAGDWLVIEDTRNRVLLYSISQDNIVHRFFGDKSAVSPENNLIAIENEPGRLTIYDLNSGEPKEKLQFTSRIAFVRFNGNGKNLFVLTADQKTFLFDAKALNSSRLASQ